MVNHLAADLISYLINAGWHHSVAMAALVGPDGTVVPMGDLVNTSSLDPAQKRAIVDAMTHQHKLDAQRYAAAATKFPPGSAAKPIFPGKWSPYDRLKARLNIPTGENFGLDICHIVESPNKVFIIVIKGDNAAILEDDPGLFPSDKLVAQFRLFQETQ